MIGEAGQRGIDLVIDEFGPDGELIRNVDSPTGTEGAEPIDLTASSPGEYKLVIHLLDPAAKPGKYMMKIEQVLNAEEKGLRVAEKTHPAALQKLWKEDDKDPKAIDRFVADRKGKGPVVEEIRDDGTNLNVTYLYQGNENTEKVEVFGSVRSSTGGTWLQRFLGTNLFFGTEIAPEDSRYRYEFSVTEISLLGPKGRIQISEEHDGPDPLNPVVFDGLSVLELPAAPPQLYVAAKDSFAKGTTTAVNFQSAKLKAERELRVYTPPGYERDASADLLIVMDGGT